MKQKYKVRHKILKLLSDKFDSVGDKRIEVTEIYIHTNEILGSLKGYDDNIVWQNLEYLTEANEIGCTQKGRDSNFYILSTGRLAYFDRKYLDLGSNQVWEITYDRVKTIASLILLLIAVYTFFSNLAQTGKNEKELVKQQQEIFLLKNQVAKLSIK